MLAVAKCIIVLVAFLLCSAMPTTAQKDKRLISGVVVDMKTMSPLGNAMMHTSDGDYLADESGRVTAAVTIDEDVVFTHVGYKPARMHVSDSLAYQSIFSIMMTSDTLRLSEVIVRSRPVDVARMARTAQLKLTYEDVVAKHNCASTAYYALRTAPVAIDASMAQARQIGAYVERQSNEGMVGSDHMIFSSTRCVQFVKDLKHGDDDAIRPISNYEIQELLKQKRTE